MQIEITSWEAAQLAQFLININEGMTEVEKGSPIYTAMDTIVKKCADRAKEVDSISNVE